MMLHLLSARQRMVIDYMRGNGAVLTSGGRLHLIHRGTFNAHGLAIVVAALKRKGLVTTVGGRTVLTEEGRRV